MVHEGTSDTAVVVIDPGTFGLGAILLCGTFFPIFESQLPNRYFRDNFLDNILTWVENPSSDCIVPDPVPGPNQGETEWGCYQRTDNLNMFTDLNLFDELRDNITSSQQNVVNCSFYISTEYLQAIDVFITSEPYGYFSYGTLTPVELQNLHDWVYYDGGTLIITAEATHNNRDTVYDQFASQFGITTTGTCMSNLGYQNTTNNIGTAHCLTSGISQLDMNKFCKFQVPNDATVLLRSAENEVSMAVIDNFGSGSVLVVGGIKYPFNDDMFRQNLITWVENSNADCTPEPSTTRPPTLAPVPVPTKQQVPVPTPNPTLQPLPNLTPFPTVYPTPLQTTHPTIPLLPYPILVPVPDTYNFPTPSPSNEQNPNHTYVVFRQTSPYIPEVLPFNSSRNPLDFMIELWNEPDELTHSYLIKSENDSEGTGYGLLMEDNGPGLTLLQQENRMFFWACEVLDGERTLKVFSVQPVQISVLVHLICIYNSSQLTLYVNAEYQNSIPANMSINVDSDMHIGQDYNGTITYLTIYNITNMEITQNTIIQNYNDFNCSEYGICDEYGGCINTDGEYCSPQDPLNTYYAIGFISLIFLLTTLAFCVSRRRSKSKTTVHGSIIVAGFSVISLASDFSFIAVLTTEKSPLAIYGWIFIVISIVLNIGFIMHILVTELKTVEVSHWFSKNITSATVAVVPCISNCDVIQILYSRISPVFYAPISEETKVRLVWYSPAGHFAKDIPQWILQSIIVSSKPRTVIPFFSLVFSSISILFGIIKRCLNLFVTSQNQKTLQQKQQKAKHIGGGEAHIQLYHANQKNDGFDAADSRPKKKEKKHQQAQTNSKQCATPKTLDAKCVEENCDKRFSNRSNMKRHHATNHVNIPEGIQCEMCGEIVLEYSWANHKKSKMHQKLNRNKITPSLLITHKIVQILINVVCASRNPKTGWQSLATMQNVALTA